MTMEDDEGIPDTAQLEQPDKQLADSDESELLDQLVTGEPI